MARSLSSAASGRDAAREPAREIGVLHGFRALFVLLVSCFHIWQQSWLRPVIEIGGLSLNLEFVVRSGYLFVDGMLLLSAFLLYLPYARAMAAARGEGERPAFPRVLPFYWKRLIRIVPSYVLGILAVFFLIALPQYRYANPTAMARDLAAHLTFTHVFWPDTYIGTPLNAGLWTVAVEMQAYLLFPWIARAAARKPALTLSAMFAGGVAFRLYVAGYVTDVQMWFNQLPAFLDVYALGILGAMAYVRLEGWLRAREGRRGVRAGVSAAALACFCALVPLLIALMREQASQYDYTLLRLSQMRLRLPLALTLLGLMLSSAFAPRALRFLFDNRLARFLALISYNYYIWHQTLAVQLWRAFFPYDLHEQPNLQGGYTLLCYLAAIAVATLITLFIERPIAARLQKVTWPRRTRRQGRDTHEGSTGAGAGEAAGAVFD